MKLIGNRLSIENLVKALKWQEILVSDLANDGGMKNSRILTSD